jgi:ABC-type amino acid transport substrate-binding protein
VGVKHGSAAEEELVTSHVGVIRFDTVDDGMRATDSGEIEAFVHDQPFCRPSRTNMYPGRLRVLPITFDPQLYGFAFPSGSGLRKKVNVTMLRLLEDREYRKRLFGTYLGKAATY